MKYDIFVILGVVQGLFLTTIVYRLSYNKQENSFFLICYFISISIAMASRLLVRLSFHEQIPNLLLFVGIDLPLSLMNTPFLYLYSKRIAEEQTTYLQTTSIFIPSVIAFIVMIPTSLKVYNQAILLKSTNETFSFSTIYMNPRDIFFVIILYLQEILYIFLLRRISHRLKVKNNPEQASWIKYCSNVLLLAFIIPKIIGIVTYLIGIRHNPEGLPPVLANTFVIFFIGYRALTHPYTINSLHNYIRDNTNSKKYKRLKLTDMKIQELAAQLKHLACVEKIFLDPDLTLQKLAEYLEVNRNIASFIINVTMKMNFIDYINSLRIQEMLDELKKRSEFNILNLAFNAGFNSKTAFNRAFKKHMGMTPSEYIRKHVNNNSLFSFSNEQSE